MAESCSVELDFHDSPPLNQYVPNALVEYVNTWPRFGFPKEFAVSLFLQNEGNGYYEVDDDVHHPFPYITGIFMWSFILSSLLIMYILIMLAYSSHQALSKGRQTEEAEQRADPTHVEDITNSRRVQATREQQYQQQQHSIEVQMGNSDLESHRQQYKSNDMRGPGTFKGEDLKDRGNSDHQGFLSPMLLQDFHANGGGNNDRNGSVQVSSQLDSQHILRHLQTTDETSATLPQSQFISPTVSRKRLLEAYFDSIMNTSTKLKLGNLFHDDGSEARQPPNERRLRVATEKRQSHQPDFDDDTHPRNTKPRKRWTFAQVFESPRQEDDDGSTFQPSSMKQRRTQDDYSTDASNNAKSIQEGQQYYYPEDPSMAFAPDMDKGNGDISPRTTATASSGSNSSDLQRGFINKTFRSGKGLRSSVHFHTSEESDDSCFHMLTLFSGFMLLLFIILFFSDGLVPLGNQSDSMMEAWQNVMFSSMETKQILNDVQRAQSSLYNRSSLLYEALNQSCPAIRSSLCTHVRDDYSCNLQGVPLREDWELLLDGIGIQPTNMTSRAQDVTYFNWTLANHDLIAIANIPFEASLDVWKWILRAVGICNALLFVLILLVLWSIAIPKRQFAIQNNFVRKSRAFIWLFWIATLCVWVVAITSLAGTFALSDFCVESPSDHTIHLLFGNNRTDVGHSFLSQEFWKYHIDGCPAEEYPDVFQTEIQKWLNIWGPTKKLHGSLQSLSATQFDLTCGGIGDGQSLHDLQLATSHFQAEVCGLVKTLTSLRRVLKCGRWYPHFDVIVYKSLCGHGAHGVGWTALAEWIIVVMSLTVWTFDFWRSPSCSHSKDSIPESGIRPIHKQRLQDDRHRKFPVIPSVTSEASFVPKRQTQIVHGRPSYLATNQSESATVAQAPAISVHPVEEMKKLPLDPPASDATFSEDEVSTLGSEPRGGSQTQSYPDSESIARSRKINRFGDQNKDGGLNNTLPVPRPTGGNGSTELVESSLFQVEGDLSDEEDLCSL